MVNGVEFLQKGLDRKGIINALKNKELMGRSFFGEKAKIAKIITSAKDSELARQNFNIIMNDTFHRSNAKDILNVATKVNDGVLDKGAYGFLGGLLKVSDYFGRSDVERIGKQLSDELFEKIELLQAMNPPGG